MLSQYSVVIEQRFANLFKMNSAFIDGKFWVERSLEVVGGGARRGSLDTYKGVTAMEFNTIEENHHRHYF